ncbi:carbon storage regulator [Pseudomonas stutzeri]|nr:carbon storage regulator [Stutzerimonas degradans]
MSGLILTRREGNTLTICAQPGTDDDDLLAERLLDDITVTLKGVKGSQARIAIEAPRGMLVFGASWRTDTAK